MSKIKNEVISRKPTVIVGIFQGRKGLYSKLFRAGDYPQVNLDSQLSLKEYLNAIFTYAENSLGYALADHKFVISVSSQALQDEFIKLTKSEELDFLPSNMSYDLKIETHSNSLTNFLPTIGFNPIQFNNIPQQF